MANNEVLKGVSIYDRVTVTDEFGAEMKGQFRGRVHSTNEYWYDEKGIAIWVTLDSGFELFIEIEKIVAFEINEKYKN